MASLISFLNTSGQNEGRIHGVALAIDVGANMTKSYTVNGSVLLDAVVPPPASTTLQDVLTNGNSGGGLNMTNVGEITCTTLHYTALDPLPASGNLEAVLTAGNDANALSMTNIENVNLNGAIGFNTPTTSSINIGLNQDSANPNNIDSLNVGNHTPSAQTLQGVDCVSVGHNAGHTLQSQYSTCIGSYAGLQGTGIASVNLGCAAGQNGQGDNCIVINATGANLSPDQNNSCYVKPVRRNLSVLSTCNLVYQDSGTGELTCNDDGFVLNATSLVSGSAGPATGDYLNVRINGVDYKLALFAP